jgi:hypothetical protein
MVLNKCTRLSALNVPLYQAKYGELTLDETLTMLGRAQPNDEQVEIPSSVMEIFVGVLGNVVSGIEQEMH